MCIEILSHLQYVKNVIYRRSKSKVVFKWKVLSTGAPSIREGRHESLPSPTKPPHFSFSNHFFLNLHIQLWIITPFLEGGCERIFMIFGRIFFSFFFFKIFLDLSPPPTNTQHTFKSIARCPFQVTISILNYII